MRRRAAVAALLAGGLLLAGCGSSTNGVEDLSAVEILTEVRAAVRDASSAHLTGTIGSADTGIEIDLTLTADGGANGTLTNGEQVITLLAVDGTTWYAANEAFWTGKVDAAKVAEVADKYVKLPATDSTFDDFTDWDAFWQGALDPEGVAQKGDVTEFDGRQVVELIDTKTDGVLYVALEGEPYPVGVRGGKDQGTVTLSDWNAPVTLEPPAEADTVDPALIGG